jgi:hypothetical protein
VIQYYRYRSSICGSGPTCNFDGTIRTRPGFEQAEVFLTGFALERTNSSAPLQGISASVDKVRYDVATGDLAVRVYGTFQGGQSFTHEISFVVVLTSNAAAKFTPLGNGCSDAILCHVVSMHASAVPVGMRFIGFATRKYFLGTNGAPLNVNALSMSKDGISGFSPGGSGNLDYVCAFRDAASAQKMFCEWSASIIAFDPAEMVAVSGSPLPETMFLGQAHATFRTTDTYHLVGGGSTRGIFNALEGVSLFYTGTQDEPVWRVEASASGFQISGSPPDSGSTEYGLFLGTTFGDTANTTLFNYQMWRAVGFLR